METWVRTSHKKSLPKLRTEIHAELVDPLFIKAGVNIKDEDDIQKHRKDNLVCCYAYFLRELKRIKKKESQKELFPILKEFHSCYKKIISAANKKGHVDLPFSWMFDCLRSNVPLLKLSERITQKEKEKVDIEKSLENCLDKFFIDEERRDELWRTLSEVSEEIDQIKLEKIAREFEVDRNIDLGVRGIQAQLTWIKMARGKRGRQLDPFNVLVYHLIKKCTWWKYDGDRKPVYHKGFYKLEKGENEQVRLVRSNRGERLHRLEKNWNLILFLILDIHLHMKELPKIKKFIFQHKNKAADEALRNLKQKLLDIYKNFPPPDGYPFEYRIEETGFKKLIVTDDGRLKIISL
jgi:hypothetical protein